MSEEKQKKGLGSLMPVLAYLGNYKSRLVGASFALIFAAAATPILVGALFESTDNWNLVLLLFAAIYLAGAVCWALVDPSRHLRVAKL